MCWIGCRDLDVHEALREALSDEHVSPGIRVKRIR
jgi:hypothetical protein